MFFGAQFRLRTFYFIGGHKMSGQLILHGYSGSGLIGTGMEFFLDGSSIAKVRKMKPKGFLFNVVVF